MSDEMERYVRWYAHLTPDAPLDRHAARALLRRALADREALAEYLLEQCSPALLGEFIYRHWNDALGDAPYSDALCLVLCVMRALGRIVDERGWMATLDGFERGIVPATRILRRVCEEIGNA